MPTNKTKKPAATQKPNEEHEGSRYKLWRTNNWLFLIDKKKDAKKHYTREYKSDHAAMCAFGKARNSEAFLERIYGCMLADEARNSI